MSRTALTRNLRDDILVVANEVANLRLHHDIFWRMADVINSNQRVMDVGSALFDWLKNAYIEVGCISVRRLLDADSRSVSLLNVLVRLERDQATFTKVDFQKLTAFEPNSPFHNAQRWLEAGRDFDELFGAGKAYLDGSLVRADIDLLKDEGRSIREQANKEIAHVDRKGMRVPKTTGDLFEKYIDQLDRITRKYFYLLAGQKLEPLRFKLAFDFNEVFTFPWVRPLAEVRAGR